MTTASLKVEYDRVKIADAILARLDSNGVETVRSQFANSHPKKWFSVDGLLPEAMAHSIHQAFPQPSQMFERKSLREHKYVTSQMDRYNPQAEEALFAFHDPRLVEMISQITGLSGLSADPKLYAGGISLMTKGNFLNPHLDNSHNSDRSLYRVLNLLYYVSPGWGLASGGHLELWPNGVKTKPLTIPSLFNRLVVMTTGPESWHSVCRIENDAPRCCVSNYYFSPYPVGDAPYFRVTRFRGRPEQPVRDLMLRLDGGLRQALRKFRPQGLLATKHIYEKVAKTEK